jgi:transposase
MLYLGIDQHAWQITVSLRGETGDALLARQVSTEPDRIHAFCDQLTRNRLRGGSRSWPCWRSAGSTTG